MRITLLIGVCLSSIATAQLEGAEQHAALALVGVTIVDVDTGELQRRSTVLITADRITAVGGVKELKPPAGARIIDCKGLFLIPGLWDMHVHLTGGKEIALPAFLANGVTGVRDMGGDLKTIDAWRAQVADGALSGPRIIRAGPTVDGYKGGLENRYVVETAEDGRRAVADLEAQGVDFIKIHNAVPRAAYFALLEEAAKSGIPVAGHIPMTITPEEAGASGQASIEHTETLIEGTLPEVFRDQKLGLIPGLEQFAEDDALQLFRQYAKDGIAYTPMVIAYRSSAYRNLSTETPDARATYVAQSLRDYGIEAMPARSRAVENIRRRIVESFLVLVKTMHESEVTLLAGTDFGGRDLYPGFSLHDELALFVEAGLSPTEALRTAISNPAGYLGLTNDLGSIAPGKLADLVLLNANPLKDIHNTTQIEGVIAAGRYYSRDHTDSMLENVKARAGSL